MTHPAYTTNTAFARMVRLADALDVLDGGFSVDPRTGGDVQDGYAVSIYPEHERIIGGRVLPQDIVDYAYDHAAVLAKHGSVLGGWRNPTDGAAYLDVSIVVANREEALSLAREHGQMAIYDFRNMRSIPTV